MEVVNALGRRKSAIARIFVSEGTGKITINKRDRKSTRLNSSHPPESRMPSSA